MTSWPFGDMTLRGVVPPIVTPLLNHDEIDREGTRRLLEHILQAEIAGVFALGTTGEFSSLSLSVRSEFVRLCCQIVNGRVPVLVGIADTAFTTTIELAKVAKEAGASAVVLTTPYYFPMEQTEVIDYVKHVLDQIDMPIMLYNIPAMTKVWLEKDTLRALAKHTQIVGIKDSSGDMNYFAEILKLKELRPDWSIFVGPEHLLAQAVALGADGGVNGGANVYPKLFVATCRAALNGDQTQCETLMKRVDAFNAIYRVGAPGFRFVSATKCALACKNICSEYPAPPLTSLSPTEKDHVRMILSDVDAANNRVHQGPMRLSDRH